MEVLIGNIQSVIDFIKGNSAAHLKNNFDVYKDQKDLLMNHFHTIIITPDVEIAPYLEALLINLNIPKNEWAYYFQAQLTVYDFFKKLEQEGSLQISFVLQIIDERAESQEKKWVVATVFTVLFLTLFFSKTTQPWTLDFFIPLILSPITLPLLGLVYTVLVSMYHLHKNPTNKYVLASNRERESIFLFINMLTNVFAYTLWITSGSILLMTPMTIILFFMASATNVLKDLVALFYQNDPYETMPLPQISDELMIKQEYARKKWAYMQRQYLLLTNFMITLALSAIMVSWCLLPGSFVLTIAAIGSVGFLDCVKSKLFDSYEELFRDQLQLELQQLEQEDTQQKVISHSFMNSIQWDTQLKPLPVADTDHQIVEYHLLQDRRHFELQLQTTVPRLG